ncbi:phage holin family protein [Erythrobacter sp. sf7]|uniref:Phage holin family protein n=1 Tax=Erythrobacter fulvus TaxID=2987523 RepID=A0ABT5JKK5_9SPHN|nr:phage holin family protein [Erythrobacter fulvus]MDC8753232.1 phage holin family protein [Erythrobacter fulvus]
MQEPEPADASAAADAAGGDAEDVFVAAGDALTALREEIAVLADDARTYAEAEVAFQKTRAAIAGKTAGHAVVLLVLALVLLHIALIALAVGAVIALAPLVSIWGAIAIVVGVMLCGVVLLVLRARRDGELLAALFESDGSKGA